MHLSRLVGRLRPRRLRAFCLGAAKTGTTSVAHMFARCYRSAHEPRVAEMTGRVMAFVSGELDREGVLRWLRRRDRALHLELEASHPLGYLACELAECFPDARFVVTYRQPRDWLRSRLNFHFHRDPPEWRAYRRFIWSRKHSGYAPEEALLAEQGLWSLDAYLAQYAEQYRIILDGIPAERRLLVRTEALDQARTEIASFLCVPAQNIDLAHSNRLSVKESLLESLDPVFVQQRLELHIGDLDRRIATEIANQTPRAC